MALVGALAMALTLASAVAQDAPEASVGAPAAAVHVYYFWGDGCPVCVTQRAYLDRLEESHPEVVVHAFEVWFAVDNRELLQAFSLAFGQPMTGVPVTFIGDHGWIGFNQVHGVQMTQVVETVRAAGGPDAGARVPADLLARFLEPIE